MSSSAFLLVRDDADRSYFALLSDAEPTRLLSSITLPAGFDADAPEQLLLTLANGASVDRVTSILRGDSSSLGLAAQRCAESFGVPVRIIDIAHDAGRIATASPGELGDVVQCDEAALIPLDAAERRRRCDAVIRQLGTRDRASVADLLGDLADSPMVDRDEFSDRVRTAACVDALAVLGVRARGEVAPLSGEVVIVTAYVASLIASGSVSLLALASLVAVGRTTVLLDTTGALAAVGTAQLSEENGVSLADAVASQLLTPAGDLLVVAAQSDHLVVIHGEEHETNLPVDAAVHLPLAVGQRAEITLEGDGGVVRVELRGGLAGTWIVRGAPEIPQGVSDEARGREDLVPISAPLEVLPRSVGATGGVTGRLLLGDEVEGRLYYSPRDPDSRGWAAAQEAGILAVVSVSPETVLRARAVGIRGIVVGSLSDGEREALSASIDRRVAAGVAGPFGLLILGRRRESADWVAHMANALQSLDGSTVRFERHPAGLATASAPRADQSPEADVTVIGGPYAGSLGRWRGLAASPSTDPRGALEINGNLVAIPLGDLQRRTA